MATTVIGITFLAMLLLVGAWAYTDVLAELARGMAASLARPLRCCCSRCWPARRWGGWTAGRFARHAPSSRRSSLRCFAGGVLMGWGSLLIPGGNDGLILVGMPLAVALRLGGLRDDVRGHRAAAMVAAAARTRRCRLSGT